MLMMTILQAALHLRFFFHIYDLLTKKTTARKITPKVVYPFMWSFDDDILLISIEQKCGLSIEQILYGQRPVFPSGGQIVYTK
ncbi:hypothetical protein AT798_06950 [Megasphaera sp. DJF_B143]|nr:hypothetical protein AT798_06950 [Megasphaera sp. DJF_B143]